MLDIITSKLEAAIGVDQDNSMSLVFCQNSNLVKPIVNWLNLHGIRAERWGGYDSDDKFIWIDESFVVAMGLDYNEYMRCGNG